MQIAKRLALFIVVNLLIVATLSVVFAVTGVGRYIGPNGLDLTALALFCLIWGFTAAGISLALSRITAKWLMRVKVIDPTGGSTSAERDLVQRVHLHARAAGLPVMPQVGIYESAEANAFATGPSKSRALVAVSTGLLASMERAEVDAVLAHEVAHIANGDMVTMTLIQGVVNAFGMFLARIAGWGIGQLVREEMRSVVTIAATIIFDLVFALAGAVVVARFSRRREFRADAGAADLVGPRSMIAALESLRRQTTIGHATAPGTVAALQIAGKPSRFLKLLSSHPPLEDRIEALRRRGAPLAS